VTDLMLKPDARAQLEEVYRARTPRSAEAMARARRYMVRGLTRGWGYHRPYPLVGKRGEGPYLIDLDDNRYVDLANNGLSLIHGHAFPPVVEALRAAAGRGSGWLVPSEEQIEFAQLLCERIEAFERVRFTNSGTESGMLAMKVARAFTGRTAVLKSIDGFHGSFDDLEVGLYDRPEEPGRVYLAPFGDAEAFERKLELHGEQIAAVVLEPLLFSGLVTTAPPGFLRRVQDAAQRAGALFVLDDCLMLRLAYGGSAELYGLTPDLTFLGKFIGGGLPMGVAGGRADVMDVLDPHREQPLYHGGSFNGNLLGSVAGQIAVRDLTANEIARIDAQAEQLRAALEQTAQELGVPIRTQGVGSAFGLYVLDRPDGEIDWKATHLLHLAAVNHGVYYGTGGEFGICTAFSDEQIEQAAAGLQSALADLARESVVVGAV
jgi:glutamate-1-semialdehyde 2,1-aminomutase